MGKKYMNYDYKPKFPKFSDPEVWEELSRQCYNGCLDYSSYPADEYKYFDKLRLLYLEFKFNGMDKQTAAEVKRKLYREYTESKRRQAVSLEVYTVYQDNIKRFNDRIIKINKSKSVEEKLYYALKIVEAVTGDNVIVKINVDKDVCLKLKGE